MASSVTKPRMLAPLGFATLRTFLQTNRAALSQSPILILASEPNIGVSAASSSLSQSVPAVQQAVQHVQFTLAQQMGFRTVQATVNTAYPTVQDVEQKLELAHRTGATSTIVAVGSGAAMDLAKAMRSSRSTSTNSENNSDDLSTVILVPATYSAVIASHASHSLLIDSAEEAIVPFPTTTTKTKTMAGSSSSSRDDINGNDNRRFVIAPLESKLIAHSAGLGDTTSKNQKNNEVSSHAIYAALSITLDAWYQNNHATTSPAATSINHKDTIGTLLKQFATTLEDVQDDAHPPITSAPHSMISPQNHHEWVMDLSWQAGGLMSYGLEGHMNRSSPLALGVSLLTQLFPHVSLVTFLASLVPGLCQIVLEQQQQQQPSNDPLLLDPQVVSMLERLAANQPASTSSSRSSSMLWLPSPPQLTVADEYSGFSVPDMSLSHIHSNQALWNCFDLPDAILTRILQESLKG